MSRHPSYGLQPDGPTPGPHATAMARDDGPLVRIVDGRPCIDSTDAARALRLHSHDPLWRRYDQFRAAGKLHPVTLDPVPLYDLEAIDRLAHPEKYVEDVFEPARGVEVALIASFAALVAVIVIVAVVR